ncbi:MAG: hypothetical protein AAF614_28175, partial [Chloroflexota bacterium]
MKESGLLMLLRLKRDKDEEKLNIRQLARFYRTFGRHYRKYWKRLSLAYGSLLATIFVTLLQPWPLKLIIDNIILEEPLPESFSAFSGWFVEEQYQT